MDLLFILRFFQFWLYRKYFEHSFKCTLTFSRVFVQDGISGFKRNIYIFIFDVMKKLFSEMFMSICTLTSSLWVFPLHLHWFLIAAMMLLSTPQWLDRAIIYSLYFNLWVVSFSHCSCGSMQFWSMCLTSHLPMVTAGAKESKATAHTLSKLLLTLLLLTPYWPKKSIRLIKSQKQGKILHLRWEILLGYTAKMWMWEGVKNWGQ